MNEREARLQALRERCEKATSGPYSADDEFADFGDVDIFSGSGSVIATVTSCATVEGDTEWDAEFFAHARTDLPWLLDELTRAEERIAELEQGWIVTSDTGLRFRTIQQGQIVWTVDQSEAITFARRKDAEMFAAADEDAWRIIQVPAPKETLCPTSRGPKPPPKSGYDISVVTNHQPMTLNLARRSFCRTFPHCL